MCKQEGHSIISQYIDNNSSPQAPMMNISKQKFTAVLGLLPVLLDRLHLVELGQSHLSHLAVHQGCPTNLPETFHPGSFVLYFWPFLFSPIHRVLFSNIPAYFQWQNEKWYANRRCLLKINHDGYEQIPFSLILVVAMGISLKKKKHSASIYPSLIIALKNQDPRVVAPPQLIQFYWVAMFLFFIHL